MKRYSIRTEEAYVPWIKRFVLFHDKRHPRDMGPEEVRQFLTHLAVTHRVAASTQNRQAFPLANDETFPHSARNDGSTVGRYSTRVRGVHGSRQQANQRRDQVPLGVEISLW